MQRLIFLFFCLLVSVFARRSVPETPPRALLPKGYPYGWGMPIPESSIQLEAQKDEKQVREVKRVVKKRSKEEIEARSALRALRMAAVEDMIDGLE